MSFSLQKVCAGNDKVQVQVQCQQVFLIHVWPPSASYSVACHLSPQHHFTIPDSPRPRKLSHSKSYPAALRQPHQQLRISAVSRADLPICRSAAESLNKHNPADPQIPKWRMSSEREALMQSLANDVGNLKDHTNYTRWHSRLRRALKQQDPRYWPTLTGVNKPSTIHKLSVPDDNVVREALANKYDVSLKSITADQIAEFTNRTVHQPNEFLATWQAIDQKLLPLLLVTLGSHLHFHIRLAKTGSEAYRIIEGMFDGLAKQHVWANWINCTFSAYKTASDFVDRWRRSLAEVVYLFEDDAPSVRCQFCQFVVAVDGHPSAKSWARDAFFDVKDPPAMSIVYQSFLSRVGGREASGKAAKGLKVHWSM